MKKKVAQSADFVKKMNHKQQKINIALNQVRLGQRGHLNCIRLNPSCSAEHNLKIIEICMEYLRLGIPFMTEAIFLNNARCDILLPATKEIIEVMKSETEKRYKAKNYPSVFTIRQVRI